MNQHADPPAAALPAALIDTLDDDTLDDDTLDDDTLNDDTFDNASALELRGALGPDAPGPPPPASVPWPPPDPRPVAEADWDLSPLVGIEVLYSYEVAVESYPHLIQRELLRNEVEWIIVGRDGRRGFVGSDMMVYHSPAHARAVYNNPKSLKSYNKAPDYFYIADVSPGSEPRKSWNVWQEQGRLPDAVIELTSESTKRVDYTYKRDVYGGVFRAREYYIYKPGAETFLALRLAAGTADTGASPGRGGYYEYTQRVNGRVWSPVHKLWLGVWDGWPEGYEMVRGHERWLRFFPSAEAEAPIPVGNERAATAEAGRKQQQQRAEAAEQRAKIQQQRAEAAEQRAETEQQRAKEAERRAEKERQQAESTARGLRATLTALLRDRFGELDASAVQRVERAQVDALVRWVARVHQVNALADVFGD